MEDRLMDENTEDYLEILYWEFDSDKKKFSFSERDLFKAKMRGLIRTIQNTRATDQRCKCNMRTSLVGDGCRYCNPQHYIDMLEEQAKEADTDPLMEKMVREIEQLRVQLAGCGVAALSNTHESRKQQRVNPGDYGYSASYQDVFDAVGREMKYKELLDKMAEALEELDDMFDPTSKVGEIINKALQEYLERIK